jgi:hypothetical protein
MSVNGFDWQCVMNRFFVVFCLLVAGYMHATAVQCNFCVLYIARLLASNVNVQ